MASDNPAGAPAAKKVAVFDLDGTLLDTTRDLALAVNHTLAAFGMPELSQEQVIAYTGNGIVRLMEQSVPAGTPRDVWERAFEEFKRYYGAHALDHTLPYVGVPEVDVACAKACGCPCVSVSWGFRSREELVAAGATRIVDTPDELQRVLLSM